MSEQHGRQASTLQRPTTSDPEAWKAYWKAQDQAWRTEPEIDTKRQKELAQHRAVIPDIEKGIYPFKGMKLSRADVEWLLATHESEGITGPVDWSDESQRDREGLDVRGADLQDLGGLPLARMRGGLPSQEWFGTTEEQRNMAVVRMQKAHLWGLSCRKLTSVELSCRKPTFVGLSCRGPTFVGPNCRELTLE